MKSIRIDLGSRSYSIQIGSGLLGDPNLLKPFIAGTQVMVVSNETVAPLYLESVLAGLDEFEVHRTILPDGESYKNLDSANSIFTSLLKVPCDRKVTIIALGGGVVGDIAGFTAACYQRGVPFIQIPTTLLAQVDSSVGGKTAVNHALGKNMIGAFYQPQCVLADMDTLDTLDDRQLRAGLAEVIKCGVIMDRPFFDWLETNIDKILQRDRSALEYCIEVSCRNKSRVVTDDEREQTGVRAILNFGHTFAHAIESGMGYGTWLHGEAVAVGMIMAADLSRRMGLVDEAQCRRIRDLIDRAGLPTSPPKEIQPEEYIELMAVDKKVIDNKVRLILIRSIGEAFVCDDYREDLLLRTLQAIKVAA
ncbi:3-dehydroquinate synthase [Pseudomonadota bacterium]